MLTSLALTLTRLTEDTINDPETDFLALALKIKAKNKHLVENPVLYYEAPATPGVGSNKVTGSELQQSSPRPTPASRSASPDTRMAEDDKSLEHSQRESMVVETIEGGDRELSSSKFD